jgi:hypothetical protein
MTYLDKPTSRRKFLVQSFAGLLVPMTLPFGRSAWAQQQTKNPIFWVKGIPDHPFTRSDHPNHHLGLNALFTIMGSNGLKFYRSAKTAKLSGRSGMIAKDDVVLIKVNAQWKYRGCTNSDVVRGLIQRILEHPDGFTGEIVIIENGQGRGSLNCNMGLNYPDAKVHANANNPKQSFVYLVDEIFKDPRVSCRLLDEIRETFISGTDHVTEGYRKFENVSYPCFNTAGGHRIELKRGIWRDGAYSQKLKLINVPVLKHHDQNGSQITASLKHFYGVVSMSDGHAPFRHYGGLGQTCGKMVLSVRTPVLNIVDAIWVSYTSIRGYPASATFRANQIMASQDPVALDYCAAKYLIYPIDHNPQHHPSDPVINGWLTTARNAINTKGLLNPNKGIMIDMVTKNEARMEFHEKDLSA